MLESFSSCLTGIECPLQYIEDLLYFKDLLLPWCKRILFKDMLPAFAVVLQ